MTLLHQTDLSNNEGQLTNQVAVVQRVIRGGTVDSALATLKMPSEDQPSYGPSKLLGLFPIKGCQVAPAHPRNLRGARMKPSWVQRRL
jgi:hypothetical protein